MPSNSTENNTSPALSDPLTGGAQSPGLKNSMGIYGHFTHISQGWSIDHGNDITVLNQRKGKELMGNKNALHLDGIRSEECAGFNWSRVLFFIAASMGYILDLNLGLCVYKINSIPGKVDTRLNGISWEIFISDFHRMKTTKMQQMNSRNIPKANGC